MVKNRIYLDYAATTPLDLLVLKAMMPYLKEKFGNAMSFHLFGKEAENAVEKSREQIADLIQAEPEEIYFTSGATEANNWALRGTTQKGDHIITSAIEHHSLKETAEALQKEKREVSFIKPDKYGVISLLKIQKTLKKNTKLISIMFANNEVGVIEPIQKIGEWLQKENKKRPSKIYFHTDAVQALGYFDCNVKKLKIDLMSLSSHKIYGPKGIGVLYIKKGVPIKNLMYGGEQENHRRPGTHNVAGIVGFGEAADILKKERGKNAKNIKALRDYLIKRVLKEIPKSELNGSLKTRLPNNADFSFKNVEGESIVLGLSLKGIAVSTGSACSSGSLEPSHVLMAMGKTPLEAHGSIRVTLGKYTVKKEIDVFINELKKIIVRLRKISPKL